MTEPNASGEASPRVETILVVDDNLQNRLVAEGHLASVGYRVLQAESGAQAIERFAAEAPDLVLLDVLMPGLNGFETCQRLRALPAGPETPICFLTALEDLQSHEQAMASGADDYLTKPIRRTELLLRVKSLLRIRRFSRELEASVQTIVAKNAELEHEQAQRQQLTDLIVHDLKNSLAGILSNLEFLELETGISAEGHEALLDAGSAAKNIHRMVLNLLDVSRGEDGSLRTHPTRFSVRELVDEVVRETARRAALRNVELSVQVAQGLEVTGDRDLLRRVAENLLDNALRYAPKGSTVGLELGATNEAHWTLKVRDQGPGVPANLRERVFEKYVQLERPTGAGGRGLGLLYCRLAAEAHQGRIWIEPNEPQGSLFCVELPTEPQG